MTSPKGENGYPGHAGGTTPYVCSSDIDMPVHLMDRGNCGATHKREWGGHNQKTLLSAKDSSHQNAWL